MLTTESIPVRIRALYRLHSQGVLTSQDIFLNVVQKCIKAKDVTSGRLLHQIIIQSGYSSTEILAILAHVEHNKGQMALELYDVMQQHGVEPNKFIYISVLKASTNMHDLEVSMLLHHQIVKDNLELDIAIANMLIHTYAKCQSLRDARKIFDGLKCKDVITWGAILGGYIEDGKGDHALELFEKMQKHGTKPNQVILLCTLKACSNLGAVHLGKLIHDHAIKNGLGSDLVINGALVDMYAKCGELTEAKRVVDTSARKSVVSYCALIRGHIQQGEHLVAFEIFERMIEEGIAANEFIYATLLTACGSKGDLDRGKYLHDHILKNGIETDVVLGNTLIGMYAQCGHLEMAQKVFGNIPCRNVASWSIMISEYVRHGAPFNSLVLFQEMEEKSSETNLVIFSSILKACTCLGAIEQGKLVHHRIMRSEPKLDTVAGSTLVDMYGTCGYLEDACNVFKRLQSRNAICWGVMIARLAEHGSYRLAGKYLEDMLKHGLKPNAKVFTSLLVACNQKGEVEAGQKYFKLMIEEYGIIPSIEHVHCIVDLLSRSGHLMKASKLLETMPDTKDLSGLVSLLSSCRVHGNVQLGRYCFNHIIKEDSNCGAAYTLMSRIYADAQMWDDYKILLEMKKDALGTRQTSGSVLH